MGAFYATLEVGGMNGREFASVEALVDTGSTYTVLGSDLLKTLAIRPTERRRFQLGDDSFVEYDMGETPLRLEGLEKVTTVVFGPPGVSPLIGAVTLQIFGLVADSVNERLIPMPLIKARPL